MYPGLEEMTAKLFCAVSHWVLNKLDYFKMGLEGRAYGCHIADDDLEINF